MLYLGLLSIWLIYLKNIYAYEMLPNSLLNRTQYCQINCTRNQTISDKFQNISHCIIGQYKNM